jgi:hypothetical protein
LCPDLLLAGGKRVDGQVGVQLLHLRCALIQRRLCFDEIGLRYATGPVLLLLAREEIGRLLLLGKSLQQLCARDFDLLRPLSRLDIREARLG